MQTYSFIVSLKAFHPSQNLEYLSSALGLDGKAHWKAGDPKMTRQSTQTDAIRDLSYWSARITPQEVTSTSNSLEGVLETSLNALLARKAELEIFFETDGELYFYISLFGRESFGLDFTFSLMKKLLKARVQLQVGVYPPEATAQFG